jgi:predicted aminopeptidase
VSIARICAAWGRGSAVVACVFWLSGCQTFGYYGQAVAGEWRVLHGRVPIETLREKPSTDAALARRLETVESILEFAGTNLTLPTQGRYRTFADVGKGPIVWNVFAAGEFSVDAHEWCYPIVGCAAYRGYFHRDAAMRESARRSAAGEDVRVSGVAAYSTLGWFRDPVLSSFVYWPDADLAELLIHELAHVRVFVKGDTEFNESYASFVAREGVGEWISAHGSQQDLARWRDEVARDDRFARFMLDWRDVVARLYAQPYPEFARRLLKSEMLASIERCYDAERPLLGDRSELTVLNNADFVPWAAYEGRVPAFAALFHDVNGDWAAFHRRVAELGRLGATSRRNALSALADHAPRAGSNDETVRCESIDSNGSGADASVSGVASTADG